MLILHALIITYNVIIVFDREEVMQTLLLIGERKLI
jgi:hypothetical protein